MSLPILAKIFLNSKVEGGCWGWLLELLFDWLRSLSELPIADPWWSKHEPLLVGVACADCIVLLLDHTLSMAVCSKIKGILGSTLRSSTGTLVTL